MTAHTIDVRTHGRYLVEGPAGAPMLMGFHGYSENATKHMEMLRNVVGNRRWLIVCVQALNRFYVRPTDRAIAACWMTTEDRELVIADNIAYVTAVVAAVEREYGAARPRVFAGFSQGVAMAYRAAAFAAPCDGLLLLAGDLPPDVAPVAGMLPPILIGRGTADDWYTPEKAARDQQTLAGAGARVSEHVFTGGHVWDESFIERARVFLDGL